MELVRKAELDQDHRFLVGRGPHAQLGADEASGEPAPGSGVLRMDVRTHGAAQWLLGAAVGYVGGNDPAAGPQIQDGSSCPALLEYRQGRVGCAGYFYPFGKREIERNVSS